jgi:hypothetical protein
MPAVCSPNAETYCTGILRSLQDAVVIQDDKKFSVQLMISIHILAKSVCLAANRQGQGDTRLTLTPCVIPYCNYFTMVSDCNCLKYFCIFFCIVIMRYTETF